MSVQLWVDASAGVAGDMLLGALVDAGADLAAVRSAIEAVLPHEVSVDVARVSRAGLSAQLLTVSPTAPHQERRRWQELAVLLREADLPEPVRETALGAFGLLAQAEAAVHGVPEDEVHFHEVGAWDSVADVVGVAAALHDLGVERVTSTPVGLGSGTVTTDHGRMPVPVPAVLRLLADGPLLAAPDAELVGECATPTGVALLCAITSGTSPAPTGRVTAVGVGAGTRDTPGRANVVRVALQLPAQDGPGAAGRAGPDVEHLVEVAATVDDLDPRVWPSVVQACLEAGALDAWLVPVVMKKGRPGTVVHVLARTQDRERVVGLLLSHTPTLGVRWHRVARTALERVWREVALEGGQVRVKLGLRGGEILTATPELEDCRDLAEATGRPLRVVLRETESAALQEGLAPGRGLPDHG